VAETQYSFLARAAVEMRGAGANVRAGEDMAKTGDHIRETMERLAQRYEALGV